MPKKIYHLIDAKIPVTRGKEIIQDTDTGGIKLVFNVRTIRRLFDYFSPLAISKEIFLNPYKVNWATKKTDVPYREWGNTANPYSKVWVKIARNYASWKVIYSKVGLSDEAGGIEAEKVIDSVLEKRLCLCVKENRKSFTLTDSDSISLDMYMFNIELWVFRQIEKIKIAFSPNKLNV